MSDDKLTPTDHVVTGGEHLSRVAGVYGYRSYGPLWNDPHNRELRSKRPNPHQLAVDDWVHVPEVNLREVDRSTEARHRFRAELHPLHVELRLERWDGRPMPAVEEILIDGQVTKFESPRETVVRFPVEAKADRCRLRVGGADLVTRIGFLQPIATMDGVRERLNNLGYQAGNSSDPADLDFRSAVEEFQCDHGLVVDGKVGPATRGKLVSVHGS